jgi:nicotinamidase-related amidase
MPQVTINQALFIVDIQNDFTGPHAKMPIDKAQADEIIENINKLIEKTQRLRLTVTYIGNEYSLFDPLNIFRNFATIKGSEGANLDPKLMVINQNYFTKSKSDAFSNPELIKFLKKNEIGEVLVAGVYAEACILQTIKGAIKNGLHVKVLADGIGTKSQEKRQMCLKRYKEIGAEVVEISQLISQSNAV